MILFPGKWTGARVPGLRAASRREGNNDKLMAHDQRPSILCRAIPGTPPETPSPSERITVLS